METQRNKNEDAGTLSRAPREKKCCICGSEEVLAEIDGKLYCWKCGMKIIKEHVLRQIEMWKKLGLVPDTETK